MFTIIQARADVGFVLPSLSSIDPLDYVPFDNSKIFIDPKFGFDVQRLFVKAQWVVMLMYILA